VHPILRQAEDAARRLLERMARTGSYIPSDVEVTCRYNFNNDIQTFRLDAGAFHYQFGVRRFALMDLPRHQRGNLPNEIRNIWERLVMEWILARRSISSAGWTGRDDPVVPIEPPHMTVPLGAFDDDALRREMMRPGGLVGSGMASNAMTPQPATLTIAAMQQAIDMMGRADAERQRPCDCPRCRPDRREDGETIERNLRADALRHSGTRPAEDAQCEAASIALLKEWLSPAQLAQYEKGCFFELQGSAGRRYRINFGWAQNVSELGEDGRVVKIWCFGPAGEAGRWAGDVMLTQKLALETDEEGALKVANLIRRLASPMQQASPYASGLAGFAPGLGLLGGSSLF
jgi:hypothetical protein